MKASREDFLENKMLYSSRCTHIKRLTKEPLK